MQFQKLLQTLLYFLILWKSRFSPKKSFIISTTGQKWAPRRLQMRRSYLYILFKFLTLFLLTLKTCFFVDWHRRTSDKLPCTKFYRWLRMNKQRPIGKRINKCCYNTQELMSLTKFTSRLPLNPQNGGPKV